MRRRDGGLQERDQQRLAQEHRDALSRRWTKQVPSTALGRTVEDITSGWDGRLGREGKLGCRQYLERGGSRFLLIRGDQGVGKSTLAVTLGKHLIQTQGLSALYKSGPELLGDISYRDRDNDPIAAAARPRLLLLDDLGAGNEGLSSAQQRGLWDVLDRRWGQESHRTIITTNMSINNTDEGIGLRNWVGTTAWDRIADDLILLDMTGASFRGQ